MLLELSVLNLVIVERAVIRPAEGLTVITGETGAGKSLLLDALDLVTGARARQGLVGRWGDACTVTAVFQVHATTIARIAQDFSQELPDGQIILRRRIAEGGRSQAWVNDLPVSLAGLRTVAHHLVDIHAQHEPMRLADPAVQLGLIDVYGQHEDLAAAYAACHAEVRRLDQELQTLVMGDRESLRERDFVRYQLQEIETLAPQSGEWERLESEFRRLSALQDERALAQEALYALRDKEGAVTRHLARFARRFDDCQDPRLREVADQCRQASDLLQEVCSVCDGMMERNEDGEGVLAVISTRMDAWNTLLRKYGPDEARLMASWRDLEARLVALEGLADRRVRLEGRLQQLIQQRWTLGRALADRRRVVFDRLATEMHRHLADLAMPKAVVRLAEQVEGSESTEHGAVSQWMEVCTNPGVRPGTLREVASGGEAARLMLALSASLAQADQVPVIVYDEVDSGVGGRLGAIIGAKLAQLSRGRTVLAVTHTPQLAASGSAHYRVSKAQSDQSTVVEVVCLDRGQRMQEITDMLGGGEGARLQAADLLRGVGS